MAVTRLPAPSRARTAAGALFEPADIASAAAFRIIFGLLNVIGVLRFFAYGWIDQLYVQPALHFTFDGFTWIKPWPTWDLMYAHFAVLGVLALLVMLGCFYRPACLLFCLGFTYVELIDKTTYLNHYYWVSLISGLMVFMPLHRAASIDAWRRPALGADTVPAWVLWTLRGQIGLLYFFGGVAKLTPDWLLHAQPLKIWLAASTDVPVIGPLLGYTWVAFAMSWAGAIFDLSVPFLLLWRRTRPFAYAAVLVFHGLTARLFPLGMFPWLMIGSTLIFFPPEWPRRLKALLGERAAPRPAVEPAPRGSSRPTARQRFGGAALATFFLIQILLPLRHWGYPGPVAWTEEGFRFAWNVMLIEKSGQADFRVTDPGTGRHWVVEPRDYLTPLQARMMVTQPDMIQEFSQLVAEDFRRRGIPGVEVRADVFVSLNGRPAERLVDPDIDLAAQPRGPAPKRWILPPAPVPPP